MGTEFQFLMMPLLPHAYWRVLQNRFVYNLDDAIRTMLSTDGPYLLEAAIMQGENVMPMTPPGGAVNVMMMNEMDC